MNASGWNLFAYSVFRESLIELIENVERRKQSDPSGYKESEQYTLLDNVNKLIYNDIPKNPYRRDYLLRKDLKRFRRAKPKDRYRLFFSFSSEKTNIYYLWLNDSNTLRKEGSSSDPYAVFKKIFISLKQHEIARGCTELSPPHSI